MNSENRSVAFFRNTNSVAGNKSNRIKTACVISVCWVSSNRCIQVAARGVSEVPVITVSVSAEVVEVDSNTTGTGINSWVQWTVM